MPVVIVVMNKLIDPFFAERMTYKSADCQLSLTLRFSYHYSRHLCFGEELARDSSESRDEHSPYCRLNHESTDEYIISEEVPFAASRNKVRHILPPVATLSLFRDDSIRRLNEFIEAAITMESSFFFCNIR